jgi:hypothetical protein
MVAVDIGFHCMMVRRLLDLETGFLLADVAGKTVG